LGEAIKAQPLLFEDVVSREPHLTTPKERNNTQPPLSENTATIGLFESDGQSYKVDVVDMTFVFAMQHRSFPIRGRRRRMRPGNEPYAERSVNSR